jgi:hypothetical protein
LHLNIQRHNRFLMIFHSNIKAVISKTTPNEAISSTEITHPIF